MTRVKPIDKCCAAAAVVHSQIHGMASISWWRWQLILVRSRSMRAESVTVSGFALAFETSGALGRLAIGRDCDVLASREIVTPRAHAAEFLPTVDALCRDQGVTASQIRWVFVSSGPGSFTGLRIGITAARTLALALGIEIAAVPTLEVIAQNAFHARQPPDQVAVVLDAKRSRVYAATFERRNDRYVAIDDAREADPRECLNQRHRNCAVMGEGVHYHRAAVEASGLAVLPESIFPPRAEVVYRLGVDRVSRGQSIPPRELVPLYIRPPEAEEVWLARQSSTTRNGL